MQKDGMRVLRQQCSTCIFRPGNLMRLDSGRLADMVQSVREKGTFVVCHQTLSEPLGAVCRGSFDKVETPPVQLAKRLSFVVLVDPPTKEEVS